MSEKQKYIDFEAYERVAEPHKRERVSAWRTAIGLQQVDRLQTSEYLLDTAKRHIEGDISIRKQKSNLSTILQVCIWTKDHRGMAERKRPTRWLARITGLREEEKTFSFTPCSV